MHQHSQERWKEIDQIRRRSDAIRKETDDLLQRIGEPLKRRKVSRFHGGSHAQNPLGFSEGADADAPWSSTKAQEEIKRLSEVQEKDGERMAALTRQLDALLLRQEYEKELQREREARLLAELENRLLRSGQERPEKNLLEQPPPDDETDDDLQAPSE